VTLSHLTGDILGPPGVWRFVRAVVVIFVISAVLRMIPVPRRRMGHTHRWARPSATILALVTAGQLLVAGGGIYAVERHRSPPQHAEGALRQVPSPALTNAASAQAGAAASTPGVGVFEPSATASYRLVDEFMEATGTRPEFVLYYSGWGDPFQVQFADWAHAAGAVPFVQMEPMGVPLRNITAGRYDGYLRSFASAVSNYGHQVVLGFAPEMNGTWYAWGAGHTAPSEWIAAWRHVVNVFRAAGAFNVTWLWTVNSINAAGARLQPWWPGASYVSWVGIDGYYYRPTDTFASVFGATISEVRTFTAAPILISETAAGPSPEQAAQINGLFQGVRTNHLRGAVWFDLAQHDGPYHLNWRLEDSPGGLAAYRRAAREDL
jgi:mannan endo-1,4-beta-mannosidase